MHFVSLEDHDGFLEERLDFRVLDVGDERALDQTVHGLMIGKFVFGVTAVEGIAAQWLNSLTTWSD